MKNDQKKPKLEIADRGIEVLYRAKPKGEPVKELPCLDAADPTSRAVFNGGE